MGAGLNDFTLFENDDAVGVGDVESRWAMMMQVRPCAMRPIDSWIMCSVLYRRRTWPRP